MKTNKICIIACALLGALCSAHAQQITTDIINERYLDVSVVMNKPASPDNSQTFPAYLYVQVIQPNGTSKAAAQGTGECSTGGIHKAAYDDKKGLSNGPSSTAWITSYDFSGSRMTMTFRVDMYDSTGKPTTGQWRVEAETWKLGQSSGQGDFKEKPIDYVNRPPYAPEWVSAPAANTEIKQGDALSLKTNYSDPNAFENQFYLHFVRWSITPGTSGVNGTYNAGGNTRNLDIRYNFGYTDTLNVDTNSLAVGTYTISTWAQDFDKVSPTIHRTIKITPKEIPTTITWSNLNHTYDGSKKSATVSVNPAAAWATSDITDKGPNAGNYTVSITLNPNYVLAAGSSTSATLTIAKANQTISISPTTTTLSAGNSEHFTANGGAGSGTWSWSRSNTDIDLNTSANTCTAKFNTSGSRTVSVFKNGDANHNQSNTATAAITVSKIPVIFTFNNLHHTYTGTQKTATVAASAAVPAGTPITYTADLVKGPNAGEYTVSATATGNYSGSGSAQLYIAKADQNKPTLTITPGQILPGGLATLSPSITPQTGSAWEYTSITSTIAGYTPSIQGNLALNSHTITDSNPQTITLSVRRAGNTNYNPSPVSDPAVLVVGKKTQNGSLTLAPTRIYTSSGPADTAPRTKALAEATSDKPVEAGDCEWTAFGPAQLVKNGRKTGLWGSVAGVGHIQATIAGNTIWNYKTLNQASYQIVDRDNRPLLEWYGEHSTGFVHYNNRLASTAGYTFFPGQTISLALTARDADGIADCESARIQLHLGATMIVAHKASAAELATQEPITTRTITLPLNRFGTYRASGTVEQSQLTRHPDELQFVVQNRTPLIPTISATSPIYVGQATQIEATATDEDGNLTAHGIQITDPDGSVIPPDGAADPATAWSFEETKSHTQNVVYTPSRAGSWFFRNIATDSKNESVMVAPGANVIVQARPGPTFGLDWTSPRTLEKFEAPESGLAETASRTRLAINPDAESIPANLIVNGDTISLTGKFSAPGNAKAFTMKVLDTAGAEVFNDSITLTPDAAGTPQTGEIPAVVAIPNLPDSIGTWRVILSTESDWSDPNPATIEITYPVQVSTAEAGIEVFPNPLDFGSVHVHELSAPSPADTKSTRSLTIRNPGLGDLVIFRFKFVGSGEYTTTQIPFTIAGTATTGGIVVEWSFPIVFDASEAGTRPATLEIHHNAPNSPTVIDLTGIGLAPRMEVKWKQTPTYLRPGQR